MGRWRRHYVPVIAAITAGLAVAGVRHLPIDSGSQGNVLLLSGTMTAQSFVTQVNAAPAGALTVRPPTGEASFTVTGTWENGSACIANRGDSAGTAAQCLYIGRANVTVQRANFQQIVWLSNGLTIEDSNLVGFNAQAGPDNWTLRRDIIDPSCNYDNNVIYNATNWQIVDSTLRNIHFCPNESIHSEALFIGTGNNGGLISGNTFTHNGTTAHIFFTYFPGGQFTVADYPRNICVTGNTFNYTHNHFFNINSRDEIDNADPVNVLHINIDFTNVMGPQDPVYASQIVLSSIDQSNCP